MLKEPGRAIACRDPALVPLKARGQVSTARDPKSAFNRPQPAPVCPPGTLSAASARRLFYYAAAPQ
ncbi:hypothetical protein RSOL_544800 [Rhizoctonia solani AG-3 Rhs1AP]|uniref:Uncharacterized protein n=1 Tax=Rhizoctonia solani AG-3 Rhs1AP TaxID=1086054 RepID=X8JUX8_9AGAM|nr:hypothetical protein RSOL_544800 [Rhizoctonia solani AG-3 Rhs1AP]